MEMFVCDQLPYMYGAKNDTHYDPGLKDFSPVNQVTFGQQK